jgi:hypothetical protein
MMLTSMEYPHWIMVVGGVLVAFGLIGVASKRKTNGTTALYRDVSDETMRNAVELV